MIQQLKQKIQQALLELFELNVPVDEVKLELTNSQFEGDFTFVVFSLLRQSRKGPEATAQLIGERIMTLSTDIDSFNVVKGFLNLRLSAKTWNEFISSFSPERLELNPSDKRKIMVEYSSPNTNKPLHLGHVRNNVLGFSICRILETYGHEVVKVNLINDRGIHICKSMLAYTLFGQGENPKTSGIKGDHLVGKYYVMFDAANRKQAEEMVAKGIEAEEAARQTPLMQEAREMLLKWEQNDTAVHNLWNEMNAWVYAGFETTYKRMGVSFDHVYKESQTYVLGKDMVDDGLKAGVFYKKEDGSIWIDLAEEGLDQKLVLRADGTSVYITQDIGTAQLKYNDFHCDASIYVVGNEQDYHFQVLKAILTKLGKPYAEGIKHMSYGMVELPEGKLKTREGKVVDADNLMDEMYETAKERTIEQGKTEGMDALVLENLYEDLGQGALKYFLLKVDPTKRILFNPAESIDFHGNTGTFIQYTHARCSSILRNQIIQKSIERPVEFQETERQLLRHLQQYHTALEDAARNYSPSVIAQYMYDLAKTFNSFYNACPILKADTEVSLQFRLMLAAATAKTLKICGEMLGIRMPEKM